MTEAPKSSAELCARVLALDAERYQGPPTFASYRRMAEAETLDEIAEYAPALARALLEAEAARGSGLPVPKGWEGAAATLKEPWLGYLHAAGKHDDEWHNSEGEIEEPAGRATHDRSNLLAVISFLSAEIDRLNVAARKPAQGEASDGR